MTSNSTQNINLLVVDSHPLFREGLKRVLEMDTDFHIVAEGTTGEELLPLYKEHQPDAVLMEVNLPVKNDFESMRELLQHFPYSKVLIFSIVDDFSSVSQAIKGGASGYLLKEMDSDSIASAIKTVINGGFYLNPKLTKDFLAEFNKLAKNENQSMFLQTEVRRPYHLLTVRESEVLQLLAEGHSNRSLGETLKISEKTVKNHVSSIMRKMAVRDRTQAVVTALKNGWVELK